MAGTGLATQVTHGDETTYGTVATDITRAFEIRSEGIEDAIERLESESLRAGKRLQSYWKPNRKGAAGDVEYELLNKGFGVRFKHALGNIVTTKPEGATNARLHTATLGNINGKSFTTQVGRPAVDGTVHPFTYLGGKIGSWELAVEIDALALWTETLDFQDGRTLSSSPAGPALATPVYVASAEPLDFIGCKITVGGVDIDVTGFTLSGDSHLKTDRYFLRRSSLKKEPLEDTEPREITAELNGEFEGLTAYNRFVNGTEATLVASLRGPLIEGAFYSGLDITLARLRWDGGTPTAGGPDILEQPQTCKVLQPAAGEAVTFAYQSTDTAA